MWSAELVVLEEPQDPFWSADLGEVREPEEPFWSAELVDLGLLRAILEC